MKKIQITYLNKLILFFIIVAAVPLLTLTFLGYTFTTNILEEAMVVEASRSVEQINSQMDQMFLDYTDIVDILGTDEDLLNVLKGYIDPSDSFNSIYEKIYYLTLRVNHKMALYILNTEGQTLFNTAILPTAHKKELENAWGLFRRLEMSDGETVIYPESFIDDQGKVIAFAIGKKIVNEEDKTIGYIVIDVAREELLSIIYSLTSSNLDNVVIMDPFYYVVTDLKAPHNEGGFYDKKDLPIESSDLTMPQLSQKNGKDMLTILHKNENSFIQIAATVPLYIVNNNKNYIAQMILFSLLIALVLGIVASFFMAQNLVKPIRILMKSMEEVRDGNLNERVSLNRKDEIGLLEESYNQMVIRLRESMDKVIDKQQKLRIAEIKILQAQINPHFLYNTLDTVKWMAKMRKEDEVIVIVTQLSNIFRNSIDNQKEFVTVRENLDVVKSYVQIQLIRYDNCFTVEYAIDSQIELYMVPKLIFQPIFENAIVHGLSGEEEGLLFIKGWIEGNDLIFIIQDNGVGMTEEEVKKVLQEKNKDHIGLYNVDQRIKLYYGKDYGVSIESRLSIGTKVTIKVPANC